MKKLSHFSMIVITEFHMLENVHFKLSYGRLTKFVTQNGIN